MSILGQWNHWTDLVDISFTWQCCIDIWIHRQWIHFIPRILESVCYSRLYTLVVSPQDSQLVFIATPRMKDVSNFAYLFIWTHATLCSEKGTNEFGFQWISIRNLFLNQMSICTFWARHFCLHARTGSFLFWISSFRIFAISTRTMGWLCLFYFLGHWRNVLLFWILAWGELETVLDFGALRCLGKLVLDLGSSVLGGCEMDDM